MAKLTRLERQKREQINSIYAEHSTDKREYYKIFYDICLKNSGKDLDTLFEELNKVLSKHGEVTIDNISKKLTEMGKLYTNKSNECLYIINLGLSIKNNSMKGIIKYSRLLKEIETKREENKKKAIVNKDNRLKNKQISCEDRLGKFMDKVIKDEDISEFPKNEIYNLLDYARRNISKIDQDKYVDFIIKYNNLNTYDKKELKLFKETLEYFLLGNKNTTNKIISLNLDKEEDIKKFNELYIYGQDKLDQDFKKYPKKLRSRNLSYLDKTSKLYEKYIKMLDMMIENNDVEAYLTLNQSDRSTIDIDYEFIKKYTDEFRTIYNCYYKNIRKVASSNDECKKKMVKRFSESIFKESNDEKEL